MNTNLGVDVQAIMNSLSDGVYVCDAERRIVYWSQSAERITGWTSADVVGRQCFDNLLCHIDKDGHKLCGQEYCPLHRAIITDTGSKGSLLVYALGKNGARIPMLVSVSPMRDAQGQVIGGVETFRDASAMVQDLERAKAIQHLALTPQMPADPRVQFTTHYVPHEIVGGDFYAIRQLDSGQYGVMLADVMGHGIAAALYTMHLSQLWERYHRLLCCPVEFAATMNNELVKVVKTDESFATAICGLIDLDNRVFRFAGAGGAQVLVMHADGTYACPECSGLPFAVMEDAPYDDISVPFVPGDRLLMFSDGAIEIHNSEGAMLDVHGLIAILRQQGYPQAGIDMPRLEEALLKYSNSIRLEDDLTILEVRFSER